MLDPNMVAAAEKMVLPGVGAFRDAIACLRETKLDAPIVEHIRRGKPFFGICIGMQVLFETSEEDPSKRGLGVFPGSVRRIPAAPGLKIPHMGWNRTRRGPAKTDVLADTPDGTFFYFVHSYYPHPARAEDAARRWEPLARKNPQPLSRLPRRRRPEAAPRRFAHLRGAAEA